MPSPKTNRTDESAALEHGPSAGYHRSYRRVALNRRIIVGGAVTLAAMLLLLILKLVFMPELTLRASVLLHALLGEFIPASSPEHIPFWGNSFLTVLRVRPEIPSPILCAGVVGTAAASLVLLPRLPLAKPAVIVINLFLFMTAFHAALFLIIPGHFDESGLNLADFFLQIALVTGLAMPVLFWLVSFPLPAGPLWKLLHVLAFEAVILGLFLLKYAVFLLLCAKGTYLAAPFIVFFLCSLPDIMYMIVIFSLMVARVSRAAAKDKQVWLWA